jgi:hypothetical protein
MTRTFWLSFVDSEQPEGQRFLGVCVIDVEWDDAATIKLEIDTRFPGHKEGAEWIAAATRLSWLYGCNPGGSILSCEIPSTQLVPRNRLLVGDELAYWAKEPVGKAH